MFEVHQFSRAKVTYFRCLREAAEFAVRLGCLYSVSDTDAMRWLTRRELLAVLQVKHDWREGF